MPAHPRCNRTKGGHVFKPTPLIQGYLERVARKADEATRLRDRYASDRRVDLAIDTLLQADEKGKLSPEQRERMRELAALHDSNRVPHDRGKPQLRHDLLRRVPLPRHQSVLHMARSHTSGRTTSQGSGQKQDKPFPSGWLRSLLAQP